MHYLYKLTFSSGKCYIGQTVRKMISRITQHRQSVRTGSMLPVHCAWRIYGEPFVEVIGEFETSDQLHAAEIAAIKNHNTLSPFGYNLGAGGETAPSKNSEVAKKISVKAKGRKHSDTVIAAMSANSKQRWENQEYRDKVLNAVKASWTPERRLARSEKSKTLWANRKINGWEVSESTKEKMRQREFSEDHRAKMSAAAKARVRVKVTENTRNKLSETAKTAWNNPEITAKRTASIRAAWTPEKKAEMAAKAAELWKNPEIRAKRLEAMRKAKTEK